MQWKSSGVGSVFLRLQQRYEQHGGTNVRLRAVKVNRLVCQSREVLPGGGQMSHGFVSEQKG